MAEIDVNAYATTAANAAAGAPSVIETQQPGATGALRQVVAIGDPTTRTSIQTVKPASTAAASTDLPAVVALHPSSPLPTGTNSIGRSAIDQTTNIIAATVMQNAAVAVGNGVNLNVQGYSTAIISISGTMSGSTIVFKESPDDVTFSPIAAHQIGITGNLLTTTTNTGEFRISCAGLKSLQAVITVYGTGSITVKGSVSVLSGHGTTVNSNIIASLPVGTNAIGTFGTALPTGTNSIGSVKIPDLATAGALAALNAAVTTAVNSQGIVAIQLTGTWVGTITFQGTEDPAGIAATSTSWFNVNGVASVTGLQVTSTTSNGQFRVNAGGYTSVRAIMTVFTSGSATVWLNASLAPSMATLAEPLPIGTNGIGTVGTTSAIINVGQKVVAATATQISATSTIPTNGIVIQALSTNTASLFIGGSTVTTTTGFELTAGQSMSFTANLNTLYIISVASTTDKICWNVE